MNLNSNQRSTLDWIFSDPIRANISWEDIESLLLACGATLFEGKGFRVRVRLNGVRTVFHRPHPERETDKGSVRSVRRFLVEAGIIRMYKHHDQSPSQKWNQSQQSVRDTSRCS